MPNYKDLLQRTERAKDRLLDCSVLLGRAARWTFGLRFVSPGHWFAHKSRRGSAGGAGGKCRAHSPEHTEELAEARDERGKR